MEVANTAASCCHLFFCVTLLAIIDVASATDDHERTYLVDVTASAIISVSAGNQVPRYISTGAYLGTSSPRFERVEVVEGGSLKVFLHLTLFTLDAIG